jgi:RNA polymerase sigma-70 factor (ECF subfamily)
VPTDTPGPQQESSIQEAQLLEALRRGDEDAFATVVDKYSGSLVRLAMAFVPSRAVAEEVVQETWIGVLEGLSRFEGRSSFKTWLFRILTNRAKTRGQRESRYESFSFKGGPGDDSPDPAVDPDRFVKSGFWVDHWATPPDAWDAQTPERILLSKEGRKQIDDAIQMLPERQRQVMTLRDIEGLTSNEICNILDLSETNQRVLLHRARSRVRQEFERYLRPNIGGSWKRPPSNRS